MSTSKTRFVRLAVYILGILGSLGAAYQFASLSIFNLWKTGFVENRPFLAQLEFFFWLYGALTVIFLGLALYLILAFSKK